MKQKGTLRKKGNSHDWKTVWNYSLKETGCLLPISGTGSGSGLTVKDTLIHMLHYFNFLQSQIKSLQSSLPPHCLPEVCYRDSESESEDLLHSQPQLLKAKRKYTSTRSHKNTTPNPESFDERNHSLHKNDPDGNDTASTKGDNTLTWSAENSMPFISDSDRNTQPQSSDSNYSLNTLLSTASSQTGSSVDQEWNSQELECSSSICEDRTGSEDVSLRSKDLDTSPSGPFLLKDRMLGIYPSLGRKQLVVSPTLSQTSVLLGTAEGLNLSPSLLTSPARGLSDPLLPSGQEELKTLFEEVWVTPKPVVLKSPIETSEEDDRSSDDINWTPKQHILAERKACRGKIFNKRKFEKKNFGLKRKCVNGFIMFCCINRRLYVKTHPGTPSSVVTKELAKVWHMIPEQERRLYCLKARHISCQQNRNVRSEDQVSEGEMDLCIPSPLNTLLAQRDLYFVSHGNL